MTINNRETFTGEINLKTTKELFDDLNTKLTVYFNSIGHTTTWPNGISETMIDLWQQIAKLETLYVEGLQEGYIEGVNDAVAQYTLGTDRIS